MLAKKLILTVALLFGSLFAASAHACKPDNSKTFLVVAQTPAGQENVVVAEIESDGSITMLRQSYEVTKTEGDKIYIQQLFDATYVFDRSLVVQDHEFCSPVIYGFKN